MSESAKPEMYAAPADEWPKKGTSGSGSGYGYSVEARAAYHAPVAVGSQTFDLRWSRVEFDRSEPPYGVPSEPHSLASEHYLLDYAQAQALRWWFVAQANAQRGMGLCIETRIVKHKITTSFAVEAISADEPLKRPLS